MKSRMIPRAVESQRRDLFRHQPDEEHDDRKKNQEDGAVRDSSVHREVQHAVPGAEDERESADRHEDAQRTENRDDLQKNEEELRAVTRDPNLRTAESWLRL